MTFREAFANIPTMALVIGAAVSIGVTQFQVQAHASDIDRLNNELNTAKVEHAEYKVKIDNLDKSQEDFQETLSEVNKTLNSVNSTLSGLQATIESMKK